MRRKISGIVYWFSLDVSELNRNKLIGAVEHELGLKGFTESETPDVLIDMNLVSRTMQTAIANTSGDSYGAGYRQGYGGGFSTNC